MSRLGNILNKIAANACIEKGTSGIWTYKKYADGTAECWGKTNITAYINTAWGGIYSSGNTIIYVDYPTNLFTSSPIETANYDCASSIMPCYISSPTATKTRGYQFARGSRADAQQTITIEIHAIGNWK